MVVMLSVNVTFVMFVEAEVLSIVSVAVVVTVIAMFVVHDDTGYSLSAFIYTSI